MQNQISIYRKKELYNEVIPIVKEYRKEKNIGFPILDTFDTLESMGFFILKFPAHKDLSGFHIKKSGIDCIFINSKHSLGRQYFSAWHECYHAITGHSGGISLLGEEEHSEMEYKANAFARCMLMPEESIIEYLNEKNLTNLKYVSYIKLIKMQNYFNVSYAALIWRLIEMYPEFQETLKSRATLGSLTNQDKMLELIREADGNEALAKSTNEFYVSERLYQKLYSNLESDRISADKAESLLDFLESIKKRYEN